MNSSVRILSTIEDHECPVCLEQTLGGELTGHSGGEYEAVDGEILHITNWWKSTCTNCKSVVERHRIGTVITEDFEMKDSVTEEVYPSFIGLSLKAVREMVKP